VNPETSVEEVQWAYRQKHLKVIPAGLRREMCVVAVMQTCRQKRQRVYSYRRTQRKFCRSSLRSVYKDIFTGYRKGHSYRLTKRRVCWGVLIAVSTERLWRQSYRRQQRNYFRGTHSGLYRKSSMGIFWEQNRTSKLQK